MNERKGAAMSKSVLPTVIVYDDSDNVVKRDQTFEQPALEKLLPICLDFARRKHAGEKIDLQEAANTIAQALGIENIDEHAVQQIEKTLQEGLGQAFEHADAAAIAAIFVQSCEPVMSALLEFAQGGKTAEELVTLLNELCFGSAESLQSILKKALGISGETAESISKIFGDYAVSVYCFAAAAKIYNAAARDAKLAKERRIEIERLANESIAHLEAERADMENMLNGWLLERLVPFGEGMSAMDQAILENDDDGFIRANAELWKLLGRDAAYKNASEFDALMESDEVFKL